MPSKVTGVGMNDVTDVCSPGSGGPPRLPGARLNEYQSSCPSAYSSARKYLLAPQPRNGTGELIFEVRWFPRGFLCRLVIHASEPLLEFQSQRIEQRLIAGRIQSNSVGGVVRRIQQMQVQIRSINRPAGEGRILLPSLPVREDVVGCLVLRRQRDRIPANIFREISWQSRFPQQIAPLPAKLRAQIEAHLLAIPLPLEDTLLGLNFHWNVRLERLRGCTARLVLSHTRGSLLNAVKRC